MINQLVGWLSLLTRKEGIIGLAGLILGGMAVFGGLVFEIYPLIENAKQVPEIKQNVQETSEEVKENNEQLRTIENEMTEINRNMRIGMCANDDMGWRARQMLKCKEFEDKVSAIRKNTNNDVLQ